MERPATLVKHLLHLNHHPPYKMKILPGKRRELKIGLLARALQARFGLRSQIRSDRCCYVMRTLCLCRGGRCCRCLYQFHCGMTHLTFSQHSFSRQVFSRAFSLYLSRSDTSLLWLLITSHPSARLARFKIEEPPWIPPVICRHWERLVVTGA